MTVLRAALCLILLSSHGMQAKATETNLIHQEKEEEKEAGIFAADLVPPSTLPSDSSNSSRLTEMGCHEEERRREEKIKRKRNSPSTSFSRSQKWKKREEVHPKKEEVKASERDGVIKKDERKLEKKRKRKKRVRRIRRRRRTKRNHKETKWWKKCKEWAESLFFKEMEKKEEKEAKKKRRLPKSGWTLVKMGRWFLLLIMFGQSLVVFNAASENAQHTTGQMTRMQGRTEANAAFWEQANPKRPRQEECEERKEMQKESRMVRCNLMKRSTWSTEKKYIRRYNSTFDILWSRAQNEERRDGGAV